MIVAIVGLPGAGKSEVTKFILDTWHWRRVYFPQTIFDELEKKSIPVNESNERKMREDLRKEFGTEVFALKAIEKIKSFPKDDHVACESFYTWEEYLLFKKEYRDNFCVLAVYAPPKERYERLLRRSFRSYAKEVSQSSDHSQIETLHQAGPIAMADALIINTGSLEELHEKTRVAVLSLVKSP